MNSYLPVGLAPLAAALGLSVLGLAAGLALPRLRSANERSATAWLLVVANIALAASASSGQPPGVRMLVMIAIALLAMKCVVASGTAALAPKRWLAFATGWPGMRPELFRHPAPHSLPGAAPLVRRGVRNALVGGILLLLARVVWTDLGSRRLATPLLLVGLSLILHFGAFNVLAGFWRNAGIDCQPLFRAPLLATSLGEFWARRWNLAFSEMTSAAVYRPLCPWIGRPAATAVAFLYSGLLHELAISFPAGTGYGGPSAYFALHGGLVVVERWLARADTPIDRHPWLGRLWTLAWIAIPLPLLFHRAFLDAVVWPLIGMETHR